MAEGGVIRSEIVQIGFEIDKNPLGDITKTTDDLKKGLAGSVDGMSKELKSIAQGAGTASGDLQKMAASAQALGDSGADELNNDLKETSEEAQHSADSIREMAKELGQSVSTKIKSLPPILKSSADAARNFASQLKADTAEKLHKSIQKIETSAKRLKYRLTEGKHGGEGLFNVFKNLTKIGLEKVVKGVKSIGAAAVDAGKKVANGLGKGLKMAVKGVAAGISAGVAGVVALGSKIVQVGAEYEDSVAKASTLFGAVNVDVDKYNKDMLSISSSTGIAATDLQEAAYSAMSAGISATEDMKDVSSFVANSAKLAKAGFTDTDTAISATAKTLNAYGLDVSETERIQGILIQTQNKGITTVGELGASLAQVTPTAAAFGVSFEQVGASLATMTAAGVTTSTATTQLKSLISELAKDGTTASKSLAAAAKGTKYADMSFKEMQESGASLTDVLGMVNDYAVKNDKSMVDMFSSIEAGSAALTLMTGDGAAFTENLAAMSDTAGLVDEAFGKVTSTLNGSMNKVKATMQNLGIEIYNSNEGIIAEAAQLLGDSSTQLYDAFREGGMEGLVSEVGNVAANIVTKITKYAPRVVDVAVDLVENLVTGIAQNADTIADGVAKTAASFVSGIMRILPIALEAGLELAISLVSGIAEAIPTIAEQAPAMIENFRSAFTSAIPALASAAMLLVRSLASFIGQNGPQLLAMGVELLFSIYQGIVSQLPQLVTIALDLIQTLVSGILAQLPQLLIMGVQVVVSLISGIAQSLPQVIQAAISLVQTLLTWVISNLPLIIQLGIQVVVALAGGLLQAIPQLVAAIPQLVGAILDTIFSTDWLKVGWDIIKGIGSGFLSGIKGLFGGGKESGESITQGISSGIDMNLGTVTSSASNVGSHLAGSLDAAQPTVTAAATNLTTGMTTSITAGLSESQTAISTAATDMTSGLSGMGDTAKTETDQVKAAFESMGSEITSTTTQGMTAVSEATKTGMTAVTETTKTGMTNAVNATKAGANAITSTMKSMDLHSSGVQAMNGLNNGLLAGKDRVLATARSIATSISTTINKALQVRSPSRVTMKTGLFTDAGLVKGMTLGKPKVKQAATDVAETVHTTISANTAPEKAPVRGGGTYNTFNPVFNLTINGANMSERDMERKTKQWVREALQSVFDSAARTNPVLQEV